MYVPGRSPQQEEESILPLRMNSSKHALLTGQDEINSE